MSTTVAPPPVGRPPDGAPAVHRLDDADRPDVDRLLDRHPYAACAVAARIETVGSLHPGHLGGELLATRAGDGRLQALCFAGGSVVPVCGPPDDVRAIAAVLGGRTRVATELVGPVVSVGPLWEVLAPAWGPARAVRDRQPLLVLDRPPVVAPDPEVRRAGPADLDVYVPAAVAMFTEELGVSPYALGGRGAYRARVAAVARAGRAFVRTDHRGRVVFKAEIGAVSRRTAQVQGVWVAPAHRRRGIATAALAAVVGAALRLAPAVSLYVNDYNLAARALYARLGFSEVDTLTTVLF